MADNKPNSPPPAAQPPSSGGAPIIDSAQSPSSFSSSSTLDSSFSEAVQQLAMTVCRPVSATGEVHPVALLLASFVTHSCIFHLYEAKGHQSESQNSSASKLWALTSYSSHSAELEAESASPLVAIALSHRGISGLAARLASIALSPAGAVLQSMYLAVKDGTVIPHHCLLPQTLVSLGVHSHFSPTQQHTIMNHLITTILAKVVAEKPVEYCHFQMQPILIASPADAHDKRQAMHYLDWSKHGQFCIIIDSQATLPASAGTLSVSAGAAAATSASPALEALAPASTPLSSLSPADAIPTTTGAPSSTTANSHDSVAHSHVLSHPSTASSTSTSTNPSNPARARDALPEHMSCFPAPPRKNADGTLVFREPLMSVCDGGHERVNIRRVYDRLWTGDQAVLDEAGDTFCFFDLQYLVQSIKRCRPVGRREWAAMLRDRQDAQDVAGVRIVELLRQEYKAFVTYEWLHAVQLFGRLFSAKAPNGLRFARLVAEQAHIRFESGYFDGVERSRMQVGMVRCAMVDCALALLRNQPHPQPTMASVVPWIVERACRLYRYNDGQVFLRGPGIRVRSWESLLQAIQRTSDAVQRGE